MSRSRWLGLGLAVCGGFFAGCPPGQKIAVPAWNQFHGDPAGTGQALVGTLPAKDTGAVSGHIGPVSNSSPVLAPDGSVYVATFVNAPGPQGAILRLTTGASVVVSGQTPTLLGQITTPAVDGAGNVYVARYNKPTPGTADSAVESFSPDLRLRWSISLVGGRALAPPRVLEVSGGRLIFQAYSGGSSAGGHVLVTSEQGTKLATVDACNRIEGGASA